IFRVVGFADGLGPIGASCDRFFHRQNVRLITPLVHEFLIVDGVGRHSFCGGKVRMYLRWRKWSLRKNDRSGLQVQEAPYEYRSEHKTVKKSFFHWLSS